MISDSDKESDDLGLSLPAVKTISEFEERLGKLQRLYVREARRFQRQMELSQTREEIQHSRESAFTPVSSRSVHCPKVLFEQDSQPLNLNPELCRYFSERKRDQPRQRGQFYISKKNA